MKKTLLRLACAFLCLFAITSTSANSGFCEGYKDGYQEGYCYQEQFCLKPLSPLCPLPNLGENGYQDGYNRGFLDGIHAKH